MGEGISDDNTTGKSAEAQAGAAGVGLLASGSLLASVLLWTAVNGKSVEPATVSQDGIIVTSSMEVVILGGRLGATSE